MKPQDSHTQRRVVISVIGLNSTLRRVDIERPLPRWAYNEPGQVSVPRPAATVILVRGDAQRLEVLLVQRSPRSRFMGGVWVFPGGSVDASEGDGDGALRAAAIRETAEEAGITLADAALVPFSRWITPAVIAERYDTHFFLAQVDDTQAVTVDGHEVVDHRWVDPTAALTAYRAGEIDLVFPTIAHLKQLSAFASVSELLAHAADRDIVPIEPRVTRSDERTRLVLPGEPGYEE